jgi:spermidine/putrescine transport system permease protein
MQRPQTTRQRATLLTLISPTVFWLIVFFAAPLLVILVYSFLKRGTYGGLVYEFNLSNYVRFVDPLYIKIFARSLWIASATTLLSLLVGYPLAFWLATRPARRRNTLLLLMMIPFWTNFLIRTYAWIVLLSRKGFVNTALISAGLLDKPLALLFNERAVIIGLVYGWVTEMILPCYASIVGLDFSLVEAAQDLYASEFRAFTRVVLPLTLPGIVAGSILVFIPSLGAYVTPDLLGGGKSAMIGNLISQQFGSANDWAFGSAISMVLMVLMMIGTVFYFRIAMARSENTPTGKGG